MEEQAPEDKSPESSVDGKVEVVVEEANDTTTPADAAEPPEETGPVELDAAELKALCETAGKATEYWDRILRMTAEAENFKKRAARDRQEAVRYANERFTENLLPVLDSFNMAMAAANATGEPDLNSLKTGVQMILTQFNSVLKDAGVEELDATGKQFDPSWQEAMSEQETADTPDGQVLQQLRRGYKLKDRLLRAASVVVAKAPAPEAPPKPEPAEATSESEETAV
ncbi:MAG: nucleotide exchange factor GrpE [Verrucomicrobiia bacterium]|jgi:molecular chaperone GrpE